MFDKERICSLSRHPAIKAISRIVNLFLLAFFEVIARFRDFRYIKRNI